MISATFFLPVRCPLMALPAGEVVVAAMKGVALERWMPVFM